jgi:hypothetical protein
MQRLGSEYKGLIAAMRGDDRADVLDDNLNYYGDAYSGDAYSGVHPAEPPAAK